MNEAEKLIAMQIGSLVMAGAKLQATVQSMDKTIGDLRAELEATKAGLRSAEQAQEPAKEG